MAGGILQNQMMFLKSIWSTVDATLEFFMTARGVILLVFYSYRVFPFEMETFDLEMMTSNFPIYAICGSIVQFLGK